MSTCTAAPRLTKIAKTPRDLILGTFVFLVIFVMAPWAVTQGGQSAKTMAITFDDLPKSNGVEDIEGSRKTTASILRVLKAHKAPAIAFVNEGKLYTGAQIVADRVALLSRGSTRAVPLANHT
jgi:peptidoglycan/xylan/chitin deacetylase (PgdA/CDA1 family)